VPSLRALLVESVACSDSAKVGGYSIHPSRERVRFDVQLPLRAVLNGCRYFLHLL